MKRYSRLPDAASLKVIFTAAAYGIGVLFLLMVAYQTGPGARARAASIEAQSIVRAERAALELTRQRIALEASSAARVAFWRSAGFAMPVAALCGLACALGAFTVRLRRAWVNSGLLHDGAHRIGGAIADTRTNAVTLVEVAAPPNVLQAQSLAVLTAARTRRQFYDVVEQALPVYAATVEAVDRGEAVPVAVREALPKF